MLEFSDKIVFVAHISMMVPYTTVNSLWRCLKTKHVPLDVKKKKKLGKNFWVNWKLWLKRILLVIT